MCGSYEYDPADVTAEYTSDPCDTSDVAADVAAEVAADATDTTEQDNNATVAAQLLTELFGDPVTYVVEHRVIDATGPEGTWHQEFAFPNKEFRDSFLAFLDSPQGLAIRPEGFEYRATEATFSTTDDGAKASGLAVIADSLN